MAVCPEGNESCPLFHDGPITIRFSVNLGLALPMRCFKSCVEMPVTAKPAHNNHAYLVKALVEKSAQYEKQKDNYEECQTVERHNL